MASYGQYGPNYMGLGHDWLLAGLMGMMMLMICITCICVIAAVSGCVTGYALSRSVSPRRKEDGWVNDHDPEEDV